MSPRYVHAIWCDDVRQEIGNKPSFMGVYTGGLLLQALPTVLQRLAVYMWVSSPMENPIKELSIRVARDDGFTIFELDPLDGVQDHGLHLAQFIQPKTDRQLVALGAFLGAFEIPIDCKYITAYVTTESEVMEATRLPIDVSVETFAAAFRDPFNRALPSADKD